MKTIQQLKSERKQRMFAHEYVKNGLNGAAAVRAIGSKAVALSTQSVMAGEYLNKPYVQRTVHELLKEKLGEDGIANIHKRNLKQSRNISASNTALDMYYKLEGSYSPDKSITVQVKYSKEQVEEQLKLLQDQLSTLQSLQDKSSTDHTSTV